MKGMKMENKKRYTAEELRRCIWRSLDIMKTVTVPILLGTIDGLGLGNARKGLRQLETHGYVVKKGGRVGGCHQKYVRAQNVPLLPPLCERCGEEFAVKICDPALKREREKEREKEGKQIEDTARAARELFYEEKEKEREKERAGRKGAADYPNEGDRVIPSELKERLERQLEGVSHDAA